MRIDSVGTAAGTDSYQSAASQPVAPVQQAQSVQSAEPVQDDRQSDTASVSDSVDTQSAMSALSSLVAQEEKALADDEKEDAAALEKAKDIRKILNNNTVAEFGYNEPTKKITIKIKDKETDEVIREIPSEKALKLLAKAWEIAGILVDEKR